MAQRDARAGHADLPLVAAAMLGEDRAGELNTALSERDRQVASLYGAASTRQGGRIRTEPLAAPTTASAKQEALARTTIDELDPRVHAFAWVPPTPRQSAAVDAADRRSLNGYVVAVKDVIDVAGMPTRCGSPLTSEEPCSRDATVVARVRDAGAALIGKTQCTEWALNDPAPTCNPRDPERTPGGSSAGSAVAVATGMCRATIDTQTAGDIVRPAAFNGVVGFKPTLGSLPTAGMQGVAPTFDTIGVTARTVEDAAAVFAVAGGLPATPPTPVRPARVATLSDPIFAAASPAMAERVAAVITALSEAGAAVMDLPSPIDLQRVHAAHRVITFPECAAEHRLRYATSSRQFGPRARDLIDLGFVTPAVAYVEALAVRRDAVSGFDAAFEQVDMLVMPVTPDVAPLRDTTGDSTFQIPWTLLGLPVVAIPCGELGGLPAGVQVVAARSRDAELLGYASWCEPVLNQLAA